MNRRQKKWFIILLPMIILLFVPKPVYAVKGDAVGATPIYPENQQEGDIGYFNLLVTPGQEQDIELEIKNASTTEITVDVNCLQATTSNAGVITYNDADKKLDSSVKYPFKDIATLDKKEVKIPASGSEKVKVHLKVPQESFQGKIIGGITLSEKRDRTSEEKKQSIVNEFQYAIPIVLFENTEKVEPEIKLVNVEPGLRNYRPFIETSIQNVAPINVSKMQIDGKINWKKSGKTLVSRKETNYTVAPNSSFNFGFDLQNSKVEEGEFVAELTVVADGKTFNLKKEFTITKAQAEEVNTSNLYSTQEEKSPLWIVIVLVVVLLLLAGATYFIYKKRKNKTKKKKGSNGPKTKKRTQGNKRPQSKKKRPENKTNKKQSNVKNKNNKNK